MANMEATDFGHSTVTWLLRDQESYGRWSLEARATASSDRSEFLLASRVAACDVYSNGPLIHDPPYFYQIVFSGDRYWIQRTYAKDNTASDSDGPLTELFRTVQVQQREAEARPLHGIADVIEAGRAGRTLNAVVDLQWGGARFKLEFPVKHMNMQTNRSLMQVETGPVIVPERNGPITGFVAFRDFAELEIIVSRPHQDPAGRNERSRNEIIRTPAEIQIFALEI